MKQIIWAVILPAFLCGCNQAGKDRNIQPAATTNEAAQANLNLGIEYMRRGNYEKALEKIDKAYEADPAYHRTHNVYGLLYQQLGDANQAEKHFKKAMSLNKHDSATLNNYGRFLCQSKRIEEAETIFKRAADNPLYETKEIPITNAGVCVLMNGHSAEAEAYFRRALTLNPKVPTALIHMAGISYEKEKYLSARGYLQRYLEVATHTPVSLWLGILIEKSLGDKNAVSSYALLLRNNFPDSEEASLLEASGTR